MILVGRGQIGHLLEWNHLDLQFIMISDNQVLRIVRAVEILSLRIFAWSGVVTADNEVSGTEILSNDGMPHSLPWSGHAHSERQKGQVTHSIRVFLHDRFVYSDAGIMINIAGLGEADNGVNEDILICCL